MNERQFAGIRWCKKCGAQTAKRRIRCTKCDPPREVIVAKQAKRLPYYLQPNDIKPNPVQLKELETKRGGKVSTANVRYQ